jgi:NAD(P) transhydrogenase subunit alpha
VKAAIPKETAEGETRVAAVPDTVAKLRAGGIEVWVQAGAGQGAHFSDELYRQAGATVTYELGDLYANADIVLRVQPPAEGELGALPPGSVLICMLQAHLHPQLLESLATADITAFAMERLPRISRAQPMDVLSSQASIAGYKAALLGADHLDKILPMQMTAAGTLAPARALILGAGVAGLQAIATARRLGAVVEAFDVRSAVREEVQSLGAKFINVEVEAAEGAGGYAREQSKEQLQRQQDLLTERVAAADIVISTASIPGRSAPTLITTDMVTAMRKGSVIVDVAADTGGNCECSVPGEVITFDDVVIVAIKDLARLVPHHASLTYSRNLSNLVLSLMHEGEFTIDLDDEVVDAICVTHKGELRYGG